jgi:1-deoxy-D-xylulose 5-phosphate reductoisomerase
MMEISSAIIQYIQQHRKDNVRNLALTASGKFSNNELCFILQQIEGWQKACKKLPS